MKRVFVDTSAILALLVATDARHARARRIFDRLRRDESTLSSSSYVLIETSALLDRRIGLAAVRAFHERFVPALQVRWVDGGVHGRAMDRYLDDDAPRVSLVDASSFVIAKDEGCDAAFAFDEDFRREGIPLL